MFPLTGKERMKYLAALKEKNASGEHIASDRVGLLHCKGKRDQGAMSETPGDDHEVATGSLGKAASDDVIDLAASPQKKKVKTWQKDAGRGEPLEKDVVAKVDAAYRQSFWHRDFQYR